MSAETEPPGRRPPAPARRRARRRSAQPTAAGAAAFSLRAARPGLDGRTRIDPSGRADRALKEIGIDFLHDGRARDAEGRRRRCRSGLEARALRSGAGRGADRARADDIHAARAQPRAQTWRSAGATSPSARSRARPIRSIAPADDGPAIIATTRTSSGSGRRFDSIHFWGGYPVEPIDIHASVRHLDALFDMLTLSDKPIHAYSLGRERNLDAIEMVKIARGDRRRDAGARAVAVHGHQFVLAAAARHADARGRHPDGAAQSGRRADARSRLPARWRR